MRRARGLLTIGFLRIISLLCPPLPSNVLRSLLLFLISIDLLQWRGVIGDFGTVGDGVKSLAGAVIATKVAVDVLDDDPRNNRGRFRQKSKDRVKLSESVVPWMTTLAGRSSKLSRRTSGA